MNKKLAEIRSFIAIEISGDARGEMKRVIGQFKSSAADVKWVNPDTVHLTLKFLGDVSEEKIEKIKSCLTEIVKNSPSFDIVLGEVGVFPDWKYAKVIWIGVAEGAEKASVLAELIEDSMLEEGFEKEKRPFKCHLTLGRVRGAKNKDKLKSTSSSIKVVPVRMNISKVVLFKSELTTEGAIHTPLSEFILAG